MARANFERAPACHDEKAGAKLCNGLDEKKGILHVVDGVRAGLIVYRVQILMKFFNEESRKAGKDSKETLFPVSGKGAAWSAGCAAWVAHGDGVGLSCDGLRRSPGDGRA